MLFFGGSCVSDGMQAREAVKKAVRPMIISHMMRAWAFPVLGRFR